MTVRNDPQRHPKQSHQINSSKLVQKKGQEMDQKDAKKEALKSADFVRFHFNRRLI